MDLESEKYGKHLDVSHYEIEKAISALNTTDNTFLIFERTRNTYLQAVNVADNQFMIEYQNGSVENHYQSVKNVDKDTFSEIVRLYKARNRKWRQLTNWKKLPFEKQNPIKDVMKGLFPLLLLVGFGMLFKFGDNILEEWAQQLGIGKSLLALYLLTLTYFPLYPSSVKELLEDNSLSSYHRSQTWIYVIFGPILLVIVIWASLGEIL